MWGCSRLGWYWCVLGFGVVCCFVGLGCGVSVGFIRFGILCGGERVVCVVCWCLG